jgi:hypothetical protein
MNQDARQVLLQTLLNSNAAPAVGSESHALPDASDVYQMLGQNSPKARLIAQYLAQRQAETAQDELEAGLDLDWEDADAGGREEGMSDAIRPMRQLVQDMYAELAELRERNDTLAAALGACYLCWGEDPHCEVCRGRGGPGASTPDRQLFATLVVPAARRLRRQGALEESRPFAREPLSRPAGYTERREETAQELQAPVSLREQANH